MWPAKGNCRGGECKHFDQERIKTLQYIPKEQTISQDNLISKLLKFMELIDLPGDVQEYETLYYPFEIAINGWCIKDCTLEDEKMFQNVPFIL